MELVISLIFMFLKGFLIVSIFAVCIIVFLLVDHFYKLRRRINSIDKNLFKDSKELYLDFLDSNLDEVSMKMFVKSINSPNELLKLLEDGYNSTSGIKINCKTKKGKTALTYACKYGKLESISMLLKYGANPNNIDNEGSSVLDAAINSQNEEIVKLLIEKGVKFDDNYSYDNPYFQKACRKPNLNIVKIFATNIFYTSTYSKGLISAIRNSMIKNVEYLLLEDIYVSKDKSKSKSIFNKEFLKFSREPFLIEACYTLLHCSTDERGILLDIIKVLLKAGVIINIVNASNETALDILQKHEYSFKEKLEAMEILVNHSKKT